MGGIAVEVQDHMGIGVVGEEFERDGVNYGVGRLEAEIILADELFLMLVIEVERQNMPCVERLAVRRFQSERLHLVVKEAKLLDI